MNATEYLKLMRREMKLEVSFWACLLLAQFGLAKGGTSGHVSFGIFMAAALVCWFAQRRTERNLNHVTELK